MALSKIVGGRSRAIHLILGTDQRCLFGLLVLVRLEVEELHAPHAVGIQVVALQFHFKSTQPQFNQPSGVPVIDLFDFFFGRKLKIHRRLNKVLLHEVVGILGGLVSD